MTTRERVVVANVTCPCCDGHKTHWRRRDVDDYDEIGCACCDSTGEVHDCEHCAGEGWYERPVIRDVRACQHCDDEGWYERPIIRERARCQVCRGRGHSGIPCDDLPESAEDAR